MDEYMNLHQGKIPDGETISGQRFIFFPQPDGLNTGTYRSAGGHSMMSEDGYIHPETWKWRFDPDSGDTAGRVRFRIRWNWSCCKYYIGEATRLAAQYENLFYDGRRIDALAVSEQILSGSGAGARKRKAGSAVQ